jgi:hypothetical protein
MTAVSSLPASRLSKQRILMMALIAGCAACARHDTKLAQHTKALESLGSTTATIGSAWLAATPHIGRWIEALEHAKPAG